MALSEKQLTKALTDRLFPILVIDSVALQDHAVLIVLAIDAEGKKQVLRPRAGSAENNRAAKELLPDLVDRRLRQEQTRFFVIDGAKVLRTAIRRVFGHLGVV